CSGSLPERQATDLPFCWNERLPPCQSARTANCCATSSLEWQAALAGSAGTGSYYFASLQEIRRGPYPDEP
ncbi:hypothetical protein, partial [Aminobacter sp. J15]|uniref:hypothetical protein n=1 Tax=Aminobacter sp. J15 TaxID=935260 RepID=UPI001AEE97B0